MDGAPYPTLGGSGVLTDFPHHLMIVGRNGPEFRLWQKRKTSSLSIAAPEECPMSDAAPQPPNPEPSRKPTPPRGEASPPAPTP